MRLSSNEINAGLVVTERDVLPGDLFPVVFFLSGDHMTQKFPFSSVNKQSEHNLRRQGGNSPVLP